MQRKAIPSTLALVSLLSSMFSVRAADVLFYWVTKSQTWEQTAPAVVSLSGDDTYIFEARFIEGEPGGVGSGGIKPPGGLERPFDMLSDVLGYVWSADGDIGIPAFNTQFPNGDYQFRFMTMHDGMKTPTVTLTGDNYPSPPQLANFTAAQNIDATKDFTLRWFPFDQGRTLDYIRLKISLTESSPTSHVETTVFETGLPGAAGALNGLATSAVLPAGTFQPGKNYHGQIWFARVTDYDATSYPGAMGYAGYGQTLWFSMRATNTSLAPAISVQPQSQIVLWPNSATLKVTATGGTPLKYQWRQNGAALSGATSSSFVVSSGDFLNSPSGYAKPGHFTVVVTNGHGAVTSQVAVITVSPKFGNHPQGQSVRVGDSAAFGVSEIIGTPPLDFQWTINGTAISAAKGWSYTINNVQPSNAGTYRLIVTNAAGTTASEPALLTVISDTAPSITLQPQSQLVLQGFSVFWSVAVSGTPPFDYQWRFNGANISGAKSSSYTISPAQPVHAGGYSVVVTNVAGAVTSSVASLTVVSNSAGFENEVLSLDGSGDYVSVPSATELQNPTELTIEFWVNPRVQNRAPRLISKSDGLGETSARSYDIGWNNHDSLGVNFFWQVQSGAPNYSAVATPLSSNRWTHVAVVFTSGPGVLQVFTNGVLADQQAGLTGRTLRQTSLPLVFGWTSPFTDTFASGYMDEIRIWSKARTPDEIYRDFHCRLAGAESNLVAYFTFDAGVATDVTGHGHDGAVFGNAAVVPMNGQDVIHAGCGKPIMSVQLATGRLPYLTVWGDVGIMYQVEVSTDLLEWTPWVTLPNQSGSIQVIDQDGPNHPKRFYRALRR